MLERRRLLTVKQTARMLRRAEATVRNYLRLGILVVDDRDPRDFRTYRLVRQHVEVRMALYEHLQRPGVKMNRQRAGRLLSQVCGAQDERLRDLLKGSRQASRVVDHLKGELDSAMG